MTFVLCLFSEVSVQKFSTFLFYMGCFPIWSFYKAVDFEVNIRLFRVCLRR